MNETSLPKLAASKVDCLSQFRQTAIFNTAAVQTSKLHYSFSINLPFQTTHHLKRTYDYKL